MKINFEKRKHLHRVFPGFLNSLSVLCSALSGLIYLTLLLVVPALGFASASSVNIVDFGAKGDGVTLNTKSIQSAIDVNSAIFVKLANRGRVYKEDMAKTPIGSLKRKTDTSDTSIKKADITVQ